MTRFKGLPKVAPPPDAKRQREEFIKAAPGKTTFPWEEPHVRDDVMLQVNVKQPERVMLQIEWLADQMKTTKRAVIERALKEFAQRELKRLGIES